MVRLHHVNPQPHEVVDFALSIACSFRKNGLDFDRQQSLNTAAVVAGFLVQQLLFVFEAMPLIKDHPIFFLQKHKFLYLPEYD
jgi:hypothetical protein